MTMMTCVFSVFIFTDRRVLISLLGSSNPILASIARDVYEDRVRVTNLTNYVNNLTPGLPLRNNQVQFIREAVAGIKYFTIDTALEDATFGAVLALLLAELSKKGKTGKFPHCEAICHAFYLEDLTSVEILVRDGRCVIKPHFIRHVTTHAVSFLLNLGAHLSPACLDEIARKLGKM